MNEPAVRNLLNALRRGASHRRLYGAEHHLTESADVAVAHAADELVGTARRAVITLLDDTLYLDGRPLGATSMAFNGIIRGLEERGVESLAFEAPTDVGDCSKLSALVCGQGPGPAPGSTITLNDDEWSQDDVIPTGSEGLRSAYTSSLEALRSVGVSLRRGTGIELGRASAAVKSLLDQLISQPGAAFLLTTVKSHHEYTFYHSVNTSILALALGRLAELDEEDLLLLGMGALLHDIGKIGVSAAILQNPGQLSVSDWAEIKRHPQLGAEAILAAANPGQEVAAVVAFEHHARFDGLGYPAVASRHHHGAHHSQAKPLHFFSRLVAVTDTYDAITTRRAYRRAETPGRALSTLLHGAGTSHDPDFVHAFIRMMGIYPPGTLLELKNGHVVMITHPADHPAAPPFGVVVADAAGSQLTDPEPVVLDKRDIVDQLPPSRIGVDPAALLDRLTEDQLLAS